MANLRFPGCAAGPCKTMFVLALLLAAALVPHAVLAASSGAMGRRSSSSSLHTGLSSSDSLLTTYVSVDTPAPPSVATDIGDAPSTVSVGFILPVAAAMYYGRPRTTVVKPRFRCYRLRRKFNEIVERVQESNKRS